MKIILFISLAGALGTLVRYLSVKAVNSVVPDSFRATLAVNAVSGQRHWDFMRQKYFSGPDLFI